MRVTLNARQIYTLNQFILLVIFLFISIQFTNAQINDATFFDRINLDFPGLEAVKKAVQQKNYPAAKKAYVQFQRDRSQPKFWASSDLPRNYPSNNRRSPKSSEENALNNTFTVLDVQYQFPGKINWTFNPTDKTQNPKYTGKFVREWAVQFNRMFVLKDLASGFVATGNPIYVTKIDELVSNWIKSCPPKFPTRQEFYNSAWRTLDAGIRAGKSWPEAWYKIKKSPAITENTLFEWAKSWMEHGDYLTKNSGTFNWLTTETTGLYTIGVLFPEFKDSHSWRDLAVARQSKQLENEFYEDGAQVELTPGYHRITIESFVSLYKLAQLNGYALDKEYTSKIEKGYEYLLKICMPDRTIPSLNDTDEEAFVPTLKRLGSSLFPNRKDFEWIMTNGKSGYEPNFTSANLPWAGQTVMRENWSINSNYLIFEYGPFGAGTHQHEDKLGIQIAGYGDLFVYEAGMEIYGDSPKRTFCRSSQAHSVITIDGYGQNRIKSKEEFGVTKTKYPITWTNTKEFDYTAATYGEMPGEVYGNGSSLLNLGVWKRHILYLKPDIFVILDAIKPNDNKNHTYHSHFHLKTTEAKIDNNSSRITIAEKGRPSFSITPLKEGSLKTELIKGQNNPLLGWELHVNKADIAIPTVRFEKKSSGNTNFAYVFKSSPKTAQPPVTNINLLTEKDGLYGVSISGDLGGYSEFDVIVTTDPALKHIDWQGNRYNTTGILIKNNAKNEVFDLNTGNLINSSTPDPDDNIDDNVGDDDSPELIDCPALENITAYKNTFQSSSLTDGQPWNAIDGDTISSAHTNLEATPWWIIDLGEKHNIKSLKIWKNLECCNEQEEKFYIFISDTPFQTMDINKTLVDSNVKVIPFMAGSDPSISIPVEAAGQFIRIQVTGTTYLSLAEVEIYGCPVDDSPAEEFPDAIWLEGECGILGNGWIVEDNPDASEGKQIVSPNNKVAFGDIPSSDPKYLATFEFNVLEAGAYQVFLNTIAPSLSDDSFWVRVNGGKWVKFNFLKLGKTLLWNQVENTDLNNAAVFFDLLKGKNVLEISVREDGTVLDKIGIKKSPELPTSLGGSSQNCGLLTSDSDLEIEENEDLELPNDDTKKKFGALNQSNLAVQIFPNPFSNSNVEVWVSLPEEVISDEAVGLRVFDMNGQVVYSEIGISPNAPVVIPNSSDWKPGFYVIQAYSGRHSTTTKIIKQ